MARGLSKIGQRYGRIVVQAQAPDYVSPSGYRAARWQCVCDCGNTTIVRGSDLTSGRVNSCGCIRREVGRESHKVDITGCQFGRLFVIKRIEDKVKPNGKHECVWECRCECGRMVAVTTGALRSGNSTSCGCYRRDRNIESKLKHGMARANDKDRLYVIWTHMRSRCNNDQDHAYKNYGGRGISVCSEWDQSFERFATWAIDNGYADNLTLDRKNNDGDYCSENCRWATRAEQNENKRNNRVVYFDGECKTLSQWARDLDIGYGTLQSRLDKYGWTVERALSTQTKSKNAVKK